MLLTVEAKVMKSCFIKKFELNSFESSLSDTKVVRSIVISVGTNPKEILMETAF